MAECSPEWDCKCQDSKNNTYTCLRTLKQQDNQNSGLAPNAFFCFFKTKNSPSRLINNFSHGEYPVLFFPPRNSLASASVPWKAFSAELLAPYNLLASNDLFITKEIQEQHLVFRTIRQASRTQFKQIMPTLDAGFTLSMHFSQWSLIVKGSQKIFEFVTGPVRAQ